jgi:hypothetical protein
VHRKIGLTKMDPVSVHCQRDIDMIVDDQRNTVGCQDSLEFKCRLEPEAFFPVRRPQLHDRDPLCGSDLCGADHSGCAFA